MGAHASTGVLRKYARLARKQGWRIEARHQGGPGGEVWYAPDGTVVLNTNNNTMPGNAVTARLTKAGLRLDDRHAKR